MRAGYMPAPANHVKGSFSPIAPYTPRRTFHTKMPPDRRSKSMIVTTGNDVPGHEISRFLGVVRGVIVRSPTIKQGILGGLKSVFGGNIESYAQVCDAARQDALDR